MITDQFKNFNFEDILPEGVRRITRSETLDSEDVNVNFKIVEDNAGIIGDHIVTRSFNSFFGSRDISERIDKDELGEEIRSELKNQGFDGDFQFAVIERETNEKNSCYRFS